MHTIKRNYRSGRAFAPLLFSAACLLAAQAALAGVENTPDNASETLAGNYLAARFAKHTGDMDEAAGYLENSLTLAPKDQELLGEAHKVLLIAGKTDKAIVMAKKFLEQQHESVTASLLVALDAVQRGDYVQADRLLAKMNTTGFNGVLIPILHAWVKVGQGDAKSAMATIAKANGIDVFSPFVLYHTALIQEVTGNNAGAEKSFERAMEGASSVSLRMVEVVGNFYKREGKPEKAEALYKKFSQSSTDVWFDGDEQFDLMTRSGDKLIIADAKGGITEVLYGTSSILYSQDAVDDAYAFLQMALYLSPDFDKGWMILAKYYEDEERFKDAIQSYGHISKDSFLRWKSQLLSARDNYYVSGADAAIAELKTLAAERDKSHAPYLHISDILRKERRFGEAADHCLKAQERIHELKSFHWPVLYSCGIALERSARWELAEKQFLKALELAPDQPDVLNYLGYSWLLLGKNTDKAKQMLEVALKKRPVDAQIVDSYGWALYHLGDYEGAQLFLERAIEIMPDDATVNDHLGDIYWRVGRTLEARYQWQRALVFDPDPDLKKALETKIREGLPKAPASGVVPPAPPLAQAEKN